MGCKYIIVSSTYYNADKCRTAFGIAAIIEGDEYLTVVEEYSDLTDQRELIKQLVDKCNESELELIHLKGVVEDFMISELYL